MFCRSIMPFVAAFVSLASSPVFAVMPVPAEMQVGSGRLEITPQWTVSVTGHDDARLQSAVDRALARIAARTGQSFPRTAKGGYARAAKPEGAALTVVCAK